MQKKALVTGGAGFVGSHLSEELLDRGFSVDVLDNFSTSRRSNVAHLLGNRRFRLHKGSIMDRTLLRRLIKRTSIVYHMAAAVGVKYILEHEVDSLLTNLKGTENILEFADIYRKKVLIVSTSEVYGKHTCAPFSEDDDRILGSTRKGRWLYSETKATDEFLALAYAKERKLPIVIVRLFNTVGPRQVGRYGMVLPRLIEEALKWKPLTVYSDGSQIRTFSYVKDVVRAIADLSVTKKAEGGIFNIGSNGPITVKALAEKIKERTGSRSPIKFISYKKAYGKNAVDFEDMQCRIPDITLLEKTIRFRPQYDLDAIIDATVAYFKEKRRKGKRKA